MIVSTADAFHHGDPPESALPPHEGGLDLAYTDASEIYRQPKPTRVAAALVEWQLI